MANFRILSLSGGGARGIFQAVFLRELQKKLGADLHGYFDLIAGTSTGSIVGMSLALGLPMEQIVKFYREKAGQVFTSRALGTFRRGTRYHQTPLRDALAEVFGSKTMRDARPVLITASSLDRFEHRVFSNIPDISSGDSELSALEVVLSS